MAEHGGGNWLVQGRQTVVAELSPASEDAGRVEKAEADLAAGYDTAVSVEDAAETVIEQRMERSAMVRLDRVQLLREWAELTPLKSDDVPEHVPNWARELYDFEGTREILEICDWVLGLKV